MPTLDWIGKDKVINHHLEVPYRVLERQYSFDEEGQKSEDNGSENMVIHGDNLSALKSLLPQYEGKIKCIYIVICSWMVFFIPFHKKFYTYLHLNIKIKMHALRS